MGSEHMHQCCAYVSGHLVASVLLARPAKGGITAALGVRGGRLKKHRLT